ncbi:MAG: hypothetical protein QF441_13495 [Bacteriovoracaceae bacterium]|jgi:hypothetical protein|nr:hypothetical protein [Bacteriovoracaceae bacterium]
MQNIFYIFFLLSLAQVSHASFLPENNLRIEKSKTLDSDEEIKQRFMPLATTIASLYQEQIAAQQATLQIKFDLKSSKVNAYATRKGPDQKLWQVVFLGGMLRHKNISNNIFISIMCHELGHHLSGGPFKKSSWVSVEGQADYFTTQNCLKKVLQHTNLIEISNQTHRFVENKCQQEYSNLVDQQYCINTSLVAQDVADFIIKLRQTRRGRREKTPKIEHRDKTIVHSLKEDHPKAQCRLDTMFEGALCNKDYSWSMHNCPFTKQFYRGSRPQCWYYPAKN